MNVTNDMLFALPPRSRLEILVSVTPTAFGQNTKSVLTIGIHITYIMLIKEPIPLLRVIG